MKVAGSAWVSSSQAAYTGERIRGGCDMVLPGPRNSGSYQAKIHLSERELEIIELVAAELTNQEIALRLSISKRTVDNHVSNIFTKTGSRNRVALVNWALSNGKICKDGFNCCTLPES